MYLDTKGRFAPPFNDFNFSNTGRRSGPIYLHKNIKIMAKRFTATEKWDDSWFSGLEPKHKLLWIFLLDKCDHAGVIDFNLRMANFCTGFDNTMDEVIKVLKDKIFVLDSGKWFIRKFIDYQYKGKLKPGVIAQKSVLDILDREHIPLYEENGVIKIDKDELLNELGTVAEQLGKCSATVQDIDKDKEKDMDLDKDIEKEMDRDTDKEKYTAREGIELLLVNHEWMSSVKTTPKLLKEFGVYLMEKKESMFSLDEMMRMYKDWKRLPNHSKQQ